MVLLELIALTLFVEAALGAEGSATRTSVRALAATDGGRGSNSRRRRFASQKAQQ